MGPEEAAKIKVGENAPIGSISNAAGRNTPSTPCSRPSSPFKVISPRSHSPGVSDWRPLSIKKSDPNIDGKTPSPVLYTSRFQDDIEKTSWVPRNIRDEFEETYIYFLKYFADKRRHPIYMLIGHDASFFSIFHSTSNICCS
jgi:hypothetical protein